MRVCTFNVHGWSDARGRSNVDAAIDLLGSLDCDVVALQEVTREGAALHRVADALGMHAVLGAESWLGNALLSRFALEEAETVAITTGYEEGRCGVIARVQTPGGAVAVCATHLDPMYEVTRLRQLEKLLAALSRRGAAQLVMGDFNALRLADYTPDRLDAVRAMREENGREAPRGEVVARMEAAGLVDVFRRHHGDDGVAALPDAARASCWVGTRVDYVWASQALLGRWAIGDARHVANEVSDHAVVVATLDAVGVGRQ